MHANMRLPDLRRVAPRRRRRAFVRILPQILDKAWRARAGAWRAGCCPGRGLRGCCRARLGVLVGARHLRVLAANEVPLGYTVYFNKNLLFAYQCSLFVSPAADVSSGREKSLRVSSTFFFERQTLAVNIVVCTWPLVAG